MVGGAGARADPTAGARRTPLTGSPFSVRISGGDTHGPACTRAGVAPGRRPRALPAAVAGVPSSMRVQARDRHGNAMARGGEIFVARLTGACDPVSCCVNDNRDGTYDIVYCPTMVGGYALAVTLDAGQGPQHIQGSRFALAVTAAPAAPGVCGVSGGGLCDTLAGVHTVFTVYGWDVYGNRAALEPSELRVQVEGEDGVTVTPVCTVRRATDAAGRESLAALQVGLAARPLPATSLSLFPKLIPYRSPPTGPLPPPDAEHADAGPDVLFSLLAHPPPPPPPLHSTFILPLHRPRSPLSPAHSHLRCPLPLSFPRFPFPSPAPALTPFAGGLHTD
jgi:hypothetical protein